MFKVVCSHMKAYSSTRLPDKKVFVRLLSNKKKLKGHEWVETMTKEELLQLLKAGYSFRW
jgi:hypothetical protein